MMNEISNIVRLNLHFAFSIAEEANINSNDIDTPLSVAGRQAHLGKSQSVIKEAISQHPQTISWANSMLEVSD